MRFALKLYSRRMILKEILAKKPNPRPFTGLQKAKRCKWIREPRLSTKLKIVTMTFMTVKRVILPVITKLLSKTQRRFKLNSH